jgi:ASC-1-like (ASCH) protein
VKSFLLPSIADGTKDLEIRVASAFIKGIATGDLLTFNETCPRRIFAIRLYGSFQEMLDTEPAGRILPNTTREGLLHGLQKLYHPKREMKGVYVFELIPPDCKDIA